MDYIPRSRVTGVHKGSGDTGVHGHGWGWACTRKALGVLVVTTIGCASSNQRVHVTYVQKLMKIHALYVK